MNLEFPKFSNSKTEWINVVFLLFDLEKSLATFVSGHNMFQKNIKNLLKGFSGLGINLLGFFTFRTDYIKLV